MFAVGLPSSKQPSLCVAKGILRCNFHRVWNGWKRPQHVNKLFFTKAVEVSERRVQFGA